MRLPPFSKLLSTYQDDLYRFLLAMLGPEEADDCFQEAVLAALRAYPRLKEDRNLKGWLFTIAYRRAMDAHRSRSRRPVSMGILPEVPVVPEGRFETGILDALGRLPNGQREAILLRFWGDLDYAGIARTLNCSKDAARKRVSEGIARLREVTSL